MVGGQQNNWAHNQCLPVKIGILGWFGSHFYHHRRMTNPTIVSITSQITDHRGPKKSSKTYDIIQWCDEKTMKLSLVGSTKGVRLTV